MTYLSSNVDECVPRYCSFFAEHLQVEQRTLAITVIELVLCVANKTQQLTYLFIWAYLLHHLSLKAAGMPPD